MSKSIEDLFKCRKDVDKVLKEFKDYWNRTQNIPLEKAPKGEIAKTLYSFMIPRFQILSPEYKEFFSKEEVEEVKRREREGTAIKKEGGTVVSLDNTRFRFKGEGFSSSPAVDKHFSYYSRNTLLGDIAKTKKGNCIAMTALFTALGRRLGLDVKPVKISSSHAAPEVVIGGRKIVMDPLLKKVTPVSRFEKPPLELSDSELFVNAVRSKKFIERDFKNVSKKKRLMRRRSRH